MGVEVNQKIDVSADCCIAGIYLVAGGRVQISIIIPVLNEAAQIIRALKPLQKLRETGHEVIIVDGESSDSTVFLARPFADHILLAQRGRGTQMNTGARIAKGDVLLFLHADTFLPEDAERAIAIGLSSGHHSWGRFDVRLSGRSVFFRLIAWSMNWRSRLTGIVTGDQALFVRSEIFAAAGGFPSLPLMEDIVLSRRLKKYSWPACLTSVVVTSSRYWEERGIIRTIFLMWFLRLAYFLGVSSERIAKIYYKN